MGPSVVAVIVGIVAAYGVARVWWMSRKRS